MTPRVSRAEFDSIRRKIKDRKDRREKNVRFNDKVKKLQGISVSATTSRTIIKAQIVRMLGLLDRVIYGPYCRLGVYCPAYRDGGHHPGEVAYHIVPQMRGDAARFVPENIVWACARANRGEQKNRSLYRDKHLSVFGKERVERIEEIARTIRQYSTQELIELRGWVKRCIENGGLDG